MEYQVSANANSDREYFGNYREAMAAAKQISKNQTEPVIVDVHNGEELCDYYYEVSNGEVRKV